LDSKKAFDLGELECAIFSPSETNKMPLNEAYNKIRIGKKIFMMHFLHRMIWNKEMFYHHWFSTLLLNMPPGRFGIDWNTSDPGLRWQY